MSGKKRMNIFTSCDNSYAPYLCVNLVNIDLVLSKNYDVRFYLLYSEIDTTIMSKIISYASGLSLKFIDIAIRDAKWLANIASRSQRDDYERYLDGVCHMYLPKDVDKALYVDTGDVLFTSENQPFYEESFEGNLLVVTKFTKINEELQNRYNFKVFTKMTWGYFNSGVVLYNVKRLRELNYTPDDYLSYIDKWVEACPENETLYGGDQAFLGAFYAGDIKSLGYKNSNNMKISLPAVKRGPEPPSSIHLNGTLLTGGTIKPWDIPFDEEQLELFVFGFDNDDFYIDSLGLQSYKLLNHLQVKYIKKWWEYCAQTPFYNEIKVKCTGIKVISALVKMYKESVMSLKTKIDEVAVNSFSTFNDGKQHFFPATSVLFDRCKDEFFLTEIHEKRFKYIKMVRRGLDNSGCVVFPFEFNDSTVSENLLFQIKLQIKFSSSFRKCFAIHIAKYENSKFLLIKDKIMLSQKKDVNDMINLEAKIEMPSGFNCIAFTPHSLAKVGDWVEIYSLSIDKL